MTPRVCLLIPDYNHSNISALLKCLALYKLSCIIVDDGSNVATKQALAEVAQRLPWVKILNHTTNQGKGAALVTGFQYAVTQGFSHVLQIDADGQHDPSDIPKFLAACRENPEALITGQPIYDESVPKKRLYGRKITNFWVRLETWSNEIKDAMCGFRIYPLRSTLTVIEQNNIGRRMDVDIDLIVRLYWQGVKVISLPTKVTYPEDGISHFKLWRDNLQISWLHTRLFFAMLARGVKQTFGATQIYTHWARIEERGSTLGMRLVLWCYKFAGRRVASWLLYPILIYFYCVNRSARHASQKYLTKVGCQASSYQHFFAFADSILDKLAVWQNDITLKQVEFVGLELFRKLIAAKQGGVIFTAHLGNIEVARALTQFDPTVTINAVLFTQNAKKITRFLSKINPRFSENIICLEKLDIPLAIKLQEKVAAGEFIVIACDRISVAKPERAIAAEFLGAKANFPEGPFIMAGILECPVYFMLCLKEPNNKFKFIFTEFAPTGIKMDKTTRQQQLQIYADKYAHLLEGYCRQYPLQWFNFFEFWCSDLDKKI